VSSQALAEEARLFPLRDAYLYNPAGQAPPGSAGIGPLAGNWTAPNPPFGAVFTYNVTKPLTVDQKLVLTIADESGRQVRRLDIDGRPGLRRVAWNLRTDVPAPSAGAAAAPGAPPQGRGAGFPGGFGFGRGAQQPPLVPPGRYRATLGRMTGDQLTPIGPAQTFLVTQIRE
jgi:hypothetical protein